MTTENKYRVYFYVGALLAIIGTLGLGYSLYTLLAGQRNQDYLKVAGFSLAALFIGGGNVWYYWNTMFHHGSHGDE